MPAGSKTMPDSLVEAVTRYTNAQRGESPFATAIAGFTILRSNNEKHPSHTILKPALCVVVQGAKWTSVGTRRFQYKAGQALVISIEIPSVSRVTEARPGRPYLAVVIEFRIDESGDRVSKLGFVIAKRPVAADHRASRLDHLGQTAGEKTSRISSSAFSGKHTKASAVSGFPPIA